MTQEQILDYLVKNKMIIKLGDQYYPIEKNLVTEKLTDKCKNYPERFRGVSIDKMYNYFLEDCKIPLNQTGNFVYLLRTKTKASETVLKKEILENTEVDYIVLTSNIQKYYADPKTVKYPIAKFLVDGLWKSFIDSSYSSSGKPDNKRMF